jgi:pimeloyl-ACP methyl ester carboxylesterase
LKSAPASKFFGSAPRLHYLEWNAAGNPAIILMHGSCANCWWWEKVVSALPENLRVLAPDLRGHGDSEWAVPPAYHPLDYARDLQQMIAACGVKRPIVAGHSMGGLCALAFADLHPELTAALVVADIAIVSSHARDRFLRRLRSLPVVTYPDLETARMRFRLMPDEGAIPPGLLDVIARRSIRPAPGGYTLKFDRETFLGGDGIETLELIRRLRVPTLLLRGEHSRIMTSEASRIAAEANPLITFREIAGAHHHLILERPDAAGEAISEFVITLERSAPGGSSRATIRVPSADE